MSARDCTLILIYYYFKARLVWLNHGAAFSVDILWSDMSKFIHHQVIEPQEKIRENMRYDGTI